MLELRLCKDCVYCANGRCLKFGFKADPSDVNPWCKSGKKKPEHL